MKSTYLSHICAFILSIVYNSVRIYAAATCYCQNSTAIEVDGYCFLSVGDLPDYTTVNNTCNNKGYDVIMPKNQQQLDKIKTAAATLTIFNTTADFIWIGLSDLLNESYQNPDEWWWDDGTKIDFKNWESGEPNGNTNENYVVMNESWTWFDYPHTNLGQTVKGMCQKKCEACVCPVEGKIIDDICFTYHNSHNYNTSKSICKDNEAHLPMPKNANQRARLNQARDAIAITANHLWLGVDQLIHSPTNTNDRLKWVWNDNTCLSEGEANWYDGEPNRSHELCVPLDLPNGKWFDVPCNSLRHVICERQCDPSLAAVTPFPIVPNCREEGDLIATTQNHCPCDGIVLNDICFTHHGKDIYLEAQNICSIAGGKLPMPRTKEQRMRLNESRLALLNDINKVTWLGLDNLKYPAANRFDKLKWVWNDNSCLQQNQMQWQSNDPSDANENCVVVNSDNQWQERLCNLSRHIICERVCVTDPASAPTLAPVPNCPELSGSISASTGIHTSSQNNPSNGGMTTNSLEELTIPYKNTETLFFSLVSRTSRIKSVLPTFAPSLSTGFSGSTIVLTSSQPISSLRGLSYTTPGLSFTIESRISTVRSASKPMTLWDIISPPKESSSATDKIPSSFDSSSAKLETSSSGDRSSQQMSSTQAFVAEYFMSTSKQTPTSTKLSTVATSIFAVTSVLSTFYTSTKMSTPSSSNQSPIQKSTSVASFAALYTSTLESTPTSKKTSTVATSIFAVTSVLSTFYTSTKMSTPSSSNQSPIQKSTSVASFAALYTSTLESTPTSKKTSTVASSIFAVTSTSPTFYFSSPEFSLFPSNNRPTSVSKVSFVRSSGDDISTDQSFILPLTSKSSTLLRSIQSTLTIVPMKFQHNLGFTTSFPRRVTFGISSVTVTSIAKLGSSTTKTSITSIIMEGDTNITPTSPSYTTYTDILLLFSTKPNPQTTEKSVSPTFGTTSHKAINSYDSSDPTKSGTANPESSAITLQREPQTREISEYTSKKITLLPGEDVAFSAKNQIKTATASHGFLSTNFLQKSNISYQTKIHKSCDMSLKSSFGVKYVGITQRWKVLEKTARSQCKWYCNNNPECVLAVSAFNQAKCYVASSGDVTNFKAGNIILDVCSWGNPCDVHEKVCACKKWNSPARAYFSLERLKNGNEDQCEL